MSKPVTFEAEVGRDISAHVKCDGVIGERLIRRNDGRTWQLDGDGWARYMVADWDSFARACFDAGELEPGEKCKVRITVERIE